MSLKQNDEFYEAKQEAEEELKPFAPNGEFEYFLMNEHAKEYHGTDDDMPDAFNDWLSELTSDDFIQYADKAINKVRKDEQQNQLNEVPF